MKALGLASSSRFAVAAKSASLGMIARKSARFMSTIGPKSGDAQFKPVIKKYLNKFPYTLFCIDSRKNLTIKLRERKAQEAKGS